MDEIKQYAELCRDQRDMMHDMEKELAAKDDLLAQNQITIQMHHSNVLELQKELAKWREIAIDLKARFLRIALPCPRECDTKCVEFVDCPQKEHWLSEAARDLDRCSYKV